MPKKVSDFFVQRGLALKTHVRRILAASIGHVHSPQRVGKFVREVGHRAPLVRRPIRALCVLLETTRQCKFVRT